MTRATRKKAEPEPEPRTRRQRSPQERAQEALDIEERRVVSLTERRDRLKAELEPIETDLAKAVKRRDFLAQSPDLESETAEAEPDEELMGT